jgi:hypothetical protein
MTELKIPGLLPGTECSTCKKGVLIVVITVDKGRSGPYGPGARTWNREIIERLGCTECSASYETSLRHKTLYQVFETQLSKKSFDESGEKEKHCPDHPSLKLVERNHFPDNRDGMMMSQHLDRRDIKYCPACLKILAWTQPR